MSDASSEHLDLDALADLEEGLIEPTAAARIREHVDGCEQCRAKMSRLRTTRALLSALPPEHMPPAVAARVEAALAREDVPSGTIVPLAGRKRAWNNPAVAGGAAAAAVVVLVAAIVAGTLVHHGNKQKSSTSAATGARSGFGAAKTAQTKQWSTGTNYTATTIATLVPRLITGTPPSPNTVNGPASHAPTSTTSSAAGSNASSTTPTYTQDELRQSPAALQACGQILAGGVVTTPVAVDFARFDGKPAVIFALPAIGHPTFLDIWVVRSSCSAANLDLYFQRIPRP